MDRWYLVAGRPWPSALEEALQRSKAFVVFRGPGEMGRWQQREFHLALDRQTSSGMPVIPVLLPGADPALGFLALNTWIDLRAHLDEERPLKLLAGAIRGLAAAELDLEDHPAAVTVCPFRGLLPYREEDAPFFFGREKSTDQLIAAVARHPFVAVLGASGSGKSSIVRASLVPRLRADRETVWEVAAMVPTARPLNSLVNSLSSLLWPVLEDEIDRREKANEKASSLEKGTLSLRDLVEIALGKQPGTQRLLLVVDQWEELYTLCRDDKAIRLFINQLLDASQSAPLTVIFTCLADFYGHVLGYRPLVDRIVEGAQVSLGPMDDQELEEVIKAPAAKMGLEYQPGLAARILGDVGQGPGRLPLLSFSLEQLWNRRRGPVLTYDAFDAMGGVDGAIATVAEDVFERLSQDDQERLPLLFIQLVSVGEESEDTRRRAAMTTLGDEARPLVAKLAKARLLVTDSDQGTETVEVAHEALIRHWKRSQGWVDNARGFLVWRKRLEPFVKAWQGDHSAFLRGGLLVEAQRWLEERRHDLDDPERDFIDLSLRQQEKERKTRLVITWNLAGLAILALMAASLAWNRWVVADEFRSLAVKNDSLAKANDSLAKANEVKALRYFSLNLAVQSTVVRDGSSQRSVLLASEAVYIYKNEDLVPVVASEQSLRDSLRNLGGLGLGGHTGPVTDVAISPDERWLVTGGYDSTARLWDLDAEEPQNPARELKGHQGAVKAVAISPDGRRLVTGSDDKTARLWDLNAKEPEASARELKGHEAGVQAVAISRDGRWLVTGSYDKTARLWDLTADRPEVTERTLKGNGRVWAVAISPDGRWLVMGSGDGTTRLWDLKADRPEATARILEGRLGGFRSVAFSPEGRWLATGGYDNARLWPLSLDDLLKQAERAVGRNFTRKEWEEVFPDEPYRKTFDRLPGPADLQPPSR